METVQRLGAPLPPIGHIGDPPYHRPVDTVKPDDYPPHPRHTSHASSSYPAAPSSAPARDRSLPSIHEALAVSRQSPPPHPPSSYAPSAAQRPVYSFPTAAAGPGVNSPPSPRSAASSHPNDRSLESEKPHTQQSSYGSFPTPSASSTYSYPPSEHRLSGPQQPPPPPSQPASYPAPAPVSSYHNYPPSTATTDRHYTPPEQHYPPPPAAYSQAPPPGHAPPGSLPALGGVSVHDAAARGPLRDAAVKSYDPPAAAYSEGIKPAYGENVKRHLDTFDLEAALNDVGDAARALHDFSNHYSQKAHQTQRSGPLPGSTPHLSEIDSMAKQTHRINTSLLRLRDVVLSQQAALAERSKEAQLKLATAPVADGAGAAAGAPIKDGFAGADPKRRRGRAAPPGRCHSCNRAETPEWRRGPDGARTLCNACGLHYAKLTRKMASNKAASGSNLQPKSATTSSPT